jgi:hypothetical protein
VWSTNLWTSILEAWARYSSPGLSFAAAVGAITCGVWLLLDWTNGAVVGSLRARLKRADDYKRSVEHILGGKTPDEAAARLGQLEAYLASLPPRSLNDDQKRAIQTAACPPPSAPYLTIVHETASAEADRYARDFVEAFSAAPGWNVVDEPYPMMPHHLSRGIAVGLSNPDDPTPTERLVLRALQDAGLGYDLMRKTSDGENAELIVSAR